MDEEKLIEMVREYPLLYDMGHHRYSDTKAKERVWLEIAEKMKEPVGACRKTWTNLRECYRRSLQRKKTASGQAAVHNRKWKFEEEMAFLNRNYEDRMTLSSINITSDDTENDALLERNDSSLTNVTTPGTPNSSGPEPASPGCSSMASKKRRVEEPRNAAAMVMEYLVKNNKEREVDSIEHYCKCIGAKLRTLDLENLLTVKKEIFSIVSDAQLRQLRCGDSSSSGELLNFEML